MRLLASICRVGRSLLPAIQRLVAITVLVDDDATANTGLDKLNASGAGGGTNTGTSGSSLSNANEGSGIITGNSSAAMSSRREVKGGLDEDYKLRQSNHAMSNPRGLFRYELIRGQGAVASAGSRIDANGRSIEGTVERPSWRLYDGTRGIRIRLKRLTARPSQGKQRRRLRELAGESNVTTGGGVILEAVVEGVGLASKTCVRVVSRGGADEPTKRGWGAGASAGAGALLEYFVESVRLLATLCRERHAANIALVRSHKGTTYQVRRFEPGINNLTKCP